MNKNPKVAIIILNYNGYDDTIECLNSLEKINYDNKDVWVLDNGSTDESVKKIEELNKDIYFIKNEKNTGQTGGDNILIDKILEEGSADYILLLDNDTIVEENFLDYLVNFAEQNNNVGVVAPLIYKYSQRDVLNYINTPGKFNLWIGGGCPHKNILKIPFKVNYASGCCWLLKKDVIKNVGMLDYRFFAYFEELDLAYRIERAGYKFFIVPESKIWHKGSATSKKVTGLRQYYETRNSILTEKKHANKLQFLVFSFYFSFYKIPKQFILSLLSNSPKKNVIKLFQGVRDGVVYKL